ncbi:MAG: hypothetical protein BWY17_03640 [Deltaproteobacteria bacterium ADurb.Bin207]|jgi:hypothetical protein|nr:MAG: hypothetical protein BWY17_03640 [Deltaproteobacteria bacterium ADurb.Bin207]
MTLAIAEPYNRSSYEGEVGESCGECWELDTLADTRIVMVHDLCPIEGNPLCAGGHFHFDLSGEAAKVLDAQGLFEGQTRRVPCPVDGNVHIQILDRNEWGYVRFQFVNHRIPIRNADYRADNDTVWRPVQRSGGAWHVLDDNKTFASGSPGGVFRITSAQGEILECPRVLPYAQSKGTVFDLGAQLTDQHPSSGGTCVFEPPRVVFDDDYGGIDKVRWTMNPWGGASDSKVTEGCFQGACIRVDNLGQWEGFHIYYRQAFPPSIFSKLTMRVRSTLENSEITVAPSYQGDRCQETSVNVETDWSDVSIEIASVCAEQPLIDAVTVSNQGKPTVILLDDVMFEK